ncbi:MAG: hypothetical protein WCG27_12630, partial [Pseudomonadota bacterium]
MRRAIKFLTLAIGLLALSGGVLAGLISQEKFKTHLRWNIFVPKDHLAINKKGIKVLINTLDHELFQKISLDFNTLSPEKEYFTKIAITKGDPASNNNVSSVEISLTNENVELFSFYRDIDKKYVLDFWVEGDSVQTTNSAVTENVNISSAATLTPVKAVEKIVDKKVEIVGLVKTPIKELKVEQPIEKRGPYRDFRYGASFVWNYPPLIPKLPETIDLKN